MYTVTDGGCNSKHTADFLMSRPNGIDCFILLLVKTPAHFQLGTDCFTVHHDSIIIICPHTPHEYYGLKNGYKDDFIRFYCSDNTFITQYSELLNRPIRLSNPLHFSQYIQHILWEHSYTPKEYRSENINMLFHVLFNKLYHENHTTEKQKAYPLYASQLQKLRLMMRSQPYKNFTASDLANEINVSISHFHTLYKDFFGISFKADLIDMRLDYAQNLIITTNLSMEQIARFSGYSNDSFFYRQFKAKTGMTPRQYCEFMRPVTHPSFLP